jgi:multicomponent Na+:H+ antiporter subunit D
VILSGLTYWLLKSGEVSVVLGGWRQGIGIELNSEGFGRLFVMMTAVAFWYIYSYLWTTHHKDHKLFLFLGMLQGALFGLYMIRDIFTMFLLIEFVTILCSILILYERDAVSVRAGLYYLIFNSVGMLIFLLGVASLYVRFGTLNLALLGTAMANSVPTQGVNFALACFLTSFAVKTAAFPVGGWLPVAHGYAPTFMSALLSGLIVKSGLYLYMTVIVPFHSEAAATAALALGVCGAVYGVVRAIFQTDIKRMLAFHTISQVGLMVIGLALYQQNGSIGGLIHAFNHFFFKSLLFLIAGVLARKAGTRNIGKITGVMRSSPFLGVAVLVGVLAITGAPWMIGSVGKYLIKKSVADGFMRVILTFVNLGTAISFSKWIAMLPGSPKHDMQLDRGKTFAIGFMTVAVVLLYPVEALMLGLRPLEMLGNEVLSYLGLLSAAALFYLIILKKKPAWVVMLGRFVPDVERAMFALVLLFGGLQWYLVLR